MDRVGEDRAGGRIHGGGVAGEGKRRGGEHSWNHNQRPAVDAKAQSPGLGDDPNDHKCGRMPAAQDSDDQQSEASRERRHEGRLHRDACPVEAWGHRREPPDDDNSDETQEARVLQPMKGCRCGVGERREGQAVQLGLVIAVSTWSSQRPLMNRYAGASPSILNPQRSRTAALRVFRGM